MALWLLLLVPMPQERVTTCHCLEYNVTQGNDGWNGRQVIIWDNGHVQAWSLMSNCTEPFWDRGWYHAHCEGRRIMARRVIWTVTNTDPERDDQEFLEPYKRRGWK